MHSVFLRYLRIFPLFLPNRQNLFRADALSRPSFEHFILHIKRRIPEEKVARIHAARDITFMQNPSSLGDWTNIEFIGGAMRANAPFVPIFVCRAKYPISSPIDACRPKPTPRHWLRHESLLKSLKPLRQNPNSE
jgi:hypothetical protein